MLNLKLRYKEGVFFFQKNIYGIKSISEAEEDFFNRLRWVKFQEDKKFPFIVTLFVGGFGNYITKKCFMDILEYVELDYEEVELFIKELRKDKCTEILTWWFDFLEVKNFQESEDMLEKKYKKCKNQ